MGTCKICNHEKRDEIERLIELGLSSRKIAEPYDFSYKTVQRHKADCMKGQDAQVMEGTGEGSEGEAEGTLTVHIEDQSPAPISAQKIVKSMDRVEELAEKMFESALAAGEYGACDMALGKIIASRGLIVDMAKIAAFGGDLHGDGAHKTAGDHAEGEDEEPPWLAGMFEEEEDEE